MPPHGVAPWNFTDALTSILPIGTKSLKVWVDRRLGRRYHKAIQTAQNMEQKVKNIEKDLKKNYHDRINNSPNKKRLKNN